MIHTEFPGAAARQDASVPPKAIRRDDDFTVRQSGLSSGHVRTLAAAVRNGGALAPVLLWREPGTAQDARLVLLDGFHRLAAYRAAKWKHTIPAEVVSCDRRTALLLMAEANARDTLPLTYAEKADMAWRLVREPGAAYTKPEVTRASGVSPRTVLTMRQRWKDMQASGATVSGRWWQDRHDDNNHKGQMEDEMSQQQRALAVEQQAEALRKIIGMWKLKDHTVTFDALERAFGREFISNAAEYLLGFLNEFEGIGPVEDGVDAEPGDF